MNYYDNFRYRDRVFENIMIILGINYSHDASAATLIDGVITAASEEEKFDRIKHSGNFPIKTLKFCLEKQSLLINDVDEICVSMDWLARAKTKLNQTYLSGDSDLCKRVIDLASKDINKRIETEKKIREELGYNGKILFLDHHDCHAAACYFPSEFKKAAVITMDGVGEEASTRIYCAQENKIEKKVQFDFPNSLGALYSLVTAHLNFKIDCDEGKIMGLAPYGDDSIVKKFKKIIKIDRAGRYKVRSDWFDFVNDGFSENFVKELGVVKRGGKQLRKKHKDLAFAVQKVLEDAVLGLAKLAKKITGSEYLCLGGGVALNSVANGKIAKLGLFKNIYIYPAPGDGGTSVGAAFYGYYLGRRKKEFHKANQTPYLGYSASQEEIVKSLQKYKLTYSKPKKIEKETAILLSQNKIVGWFSGKTEFGPRALGNRSILANPRNLLNKDRINLKIKFRELFRPFAPVVIEEFAEQYFNTRGFKSPYMSFVFEVKRGKAGVIPAVTHVDNTARIQTVRREQNEKYWKVIKEFYKITSIPILLNTSFNRAGEVIVNTPEQAIEAFLGSDLDVLVLEDYLVRKDQN